MTTRIKVLIVDDEPLARRGLRQLLEPEKDFEVVGEARNGRDAISLVARLAPDLIFLDIQMPLLDGFSFIEQIIDKGPPEIIFVTAYDEHAIRAFEAGAIDYVLKPVNPERFQKTLGRARARLLSPDSSSLEKRLSDLVTNLKLPAENYLERIAVKANDRIRFVPAERIEWITSLGNYIELHAGAETFLVREPMNGIEKKLDPHDFLRIRRSAIVRIDQIRELHPLFGGEMEVVLKSGMRLTSSRRYRKNLDALLKI